MYFTDKFPRSDLKTIHPGLMKSSPGRKQPLVHKNITSNNFQFLSKVYSDMMFNTAKASPFDNLPPKRLQNPASSRLPVIKNAEPSMPLQSTRLFELNYEEMHKEYKHDLDTQIKLHEENRIKELRRKEEATKRRLEDLRVQKENELRERQDSLYRAQEYKSVLESQARLRNNIECSQSAVFPGLKSKRFFSVGYDEISVPEKKNNNSLAVSLSTLPEFTLQKYTKKNPKVIKTNPINPDI